MIAEYENSKPQFIIGRRRPLITNRRLLSAAPPPNPLPRRGIKDNK
ncbi:MAG: hypothetical protein LBP62_01550 [Clostridiales bacterium]|nr:hypothetical protein [Clostridiales bacterium]